MEKNIREHERNIGAKKAAMLKKRRRRRRIIVALISMIVVFTIILAVLSSIFLFKIEKINIINPSLKYTNDEIVLASGIKLSDSLLFLNCNDIEIQITEKLPYIKTVQIKKSLPSVIEISCTETQNEICIFTGGKYYAADKDGKILAQLDSRDEELPLFEMSDNCSVTVGKTIEIKDGIESELFNKYVGLIEEDKYRVSSVNITDGGDSFMKVDNRLLVLIGAYNHFDLKVAHFNSMYATMSESAYGTVDLSSWSPKKQEAFFTSSEQF